jgi:hypothetical protein
MADKTVTISWNGTALTYSSAHFKIKPGNRLRWNCNDADFAILLCEDRSPFSSKTTVLAGPKSKGTKFLTVRKLTAAEKQQAGKEAFKYSVALLDAATNKLITDDPDIIIDDPGGGGGTKGKKQTKKQTKKPAKQGP